MPGPGTVRVAGMVALYRRRPVNVGSECRHSQKRRTKNDRQSGTELNHAKYRPNAKLSLNLSRSVPEVSRQSKITNGDIEFSVHPGPGAPMPLFRMGRTGPSG
jgi:hypothetical protein